MLAPSRRTSYFGLICVLPWQNGLTGSIKPGGAPLATSAHGFLDGLSLNIIGRDFKKMLKTQGNLLLKSALGETCV